MLLNRRRLMMQSEEIIPEPELPDAWKAVETISDSWEDIIYHAKIVGDYKTRYKIGDIKVADFGDEGLTAMHLVGFDCDELANGSGYCHMSWVPEHRLKTSWEWNNSDSNSGGYASSQLKVRIDSLMTKLPKSLQDGIVEVKKSCRLYGPTDQSVNVKLWAPSSREYFGADSSYEQSGPIYTKPPKPAKMTGATPNGRNSNSWLRSSDAYNKDVAMSVNTHGGDGHYTCSYSYGVLVGFSI